MILTLGVLGIVLGPLGVPLGIAAWVMGLADIQKIRENVMDPRGRLDCKSGMICGIIGTALNSIWTLLIVRAMLGL